MKPWNKQWTLDIEDPYERLLYTMVYDAFWDFYFYRDDMSIRIPAFNFLISGGGEWKEFIKTNLLRDFIRYCRLEYWDSEAVEFLEEE